MYYIFILHQTTTFDQFITGMQGCIISSFYIKPQLLKFRQVREVVVLYLHSTSNHNTVDGAGFRSSSCIISSFYIKPQPWLAASLFWIQLYYIFMLHQTTTERQANLRVQRLYYIFILHQTTTICSCRYFYFTLYYIFILHQTTTYNSMIF